MSVKPVSERLRLRVVGLDCVTCSRVIQHALRGIEGIRNVGVSFMLDLVLVDYDPVRISKDEIMGIVKKTGYDVVQAAN